MVIAQGQIWWADLPDPVGSGPLRPPMDPGVFYVLLLGGAGHRVRPCS
jgi:hypothetical protein